MTALAADRKTDKYSPDDTVDPPVVDYPVKAATKIYAGSIVCVDMSGRAVPASADPTLKVVGKAQKLSDNTAAGAADGDVRVPVERGVFFFNTPSSGSNQILAANVEALCYASDDNVVNLTDNGGQYPAAGVVIGVRADGQVAVFLGRSSLYVQNPETSPGSSASAYKVRAVLTSVAAYTVGTNGVITANANGAIGAQDGVTLVAGDQVLMGQDTAATAKDEGPYVVVSPGGAGKFQLARPDWWRHGMTIPDGATITSGSEGTANKGQDWRCFPGGNAKVVGTDAPLFWPRQFSGDVTLGAGATDTTGLWVRLSTLGFGASEATDATKTFKGTVTQGILGTGKISFTGTNTDHIRFTFANW